MVLCVFLRSLVLACCVLLLAAEGSGLQAAAPNIVFIFSDDHATQAISAYGSKINQTPNIDRIAREGGVFPELILREFNLWTFKGLHFDGEAQPSEWISEKR